MHFYFRVGTIDLARNNLTKIEREMFADLRFVDTIDVAENQITDIKEDAFKSIYLTKVSNYCSLYGIKELCILLW